MTRKEALIYSCADKVLVRKTNEILSIRYIDYADPNKVGRTTKISFLLSDNKWYGYKELKPQY